MWNVSYIKRAIKGEGYLEEGFLGFATFHPHFLLKTEIANLAIAEGFLWCDLFLAFFDSEIVKF